ncbi:unnamed protein product [Leptosia nina]|uniref:RanBD1 domain-containing protein n=1 Tax=Leptosia nina TaxID=320188 RepID=A0AAV1JUX8_9NEOP
MSAKRTATSELNHENWDQEFNNEPEDGEGFKMAAKDVLEKRVIRTAKRRSNLSNNEAPKSVFSGFGGFNKTQKSSFDFLANLTNGNKSTTSTASTLESSSIFSPKPFATSSPGLFKSEISKTSVFESPNITVGSTQSSSVVIDTKTNSKPSESPFTVKAPSTPVSNFTFGIRPNAEASTSPLQKSNNIFGNQTQNVFANNTFKSPTANPSPSSQNIKLVESENTSNKKESDGDKEHIDEKKLTYYNNIKGLNISVSEWVKKHVDETPVCILTPIFKDYERHLKQIQDEYYGTEDIKPNDEKGDFKKGVNNTSKTTEASLNIFSQSPGTNSQEKTTNITFGTSASNNTSAPSATPNSLLNKSSEETKVSSFSFASSSNTTTPVKSTGFTFGTIPKAQSPNMSNNSISKDSSSVSPGIAQPPSVPPVTGTGFSFGITSSPQTSNLFNTKPGLSGTNGNAPFSFGTGKPFSFKSSIQEKAESSEKSAQGDEDEEPPKVEYKPLVEENCVFEKKCKVFVKKDGNFVDKGVGTLYIKKIEESGKHQLLVRANTTLGNVLLNLILSSSIPIQPMGKNNVMLVCIPSPDAKPPPTPILIRVKTSEEAHELLETLNKYKT